MRKFRILFTPLAERDLLEQVSWYEKQSGIGLAERWAAAVDATLERIAKARRSGMLSPTHLPELGEVRQVSLDGFPHFLIFYQLRTDSALVLRVLHGARDIDALLT